MISSFQAQQMFAQQNALFSGQMAYAQQIGHQVNPGMGGPPPPAPFFGGGAAAYGMGAQYGERGAYRAASFGHNVAMPIASAGLGVAAGMGMMGSVGSALFDPFGSALSMGARGWAMGGGGAMGASMGMMGAAAGALPGYLAYKAADVYGGAFMGGVQDQIGMNSMLRQNFRHYGGQGAFNRGFGQQQMGAIGGMMANTARGDLSTSLQELTQITSMGAQSGQFNGVRDVQQFTQKFRQMLNALKTIQSELGGSLTEAAEFMRNANQVGVFRNLDRFASQVRTTSAATNMSQQQVMGLAATGSQMSMAMGGRGAQGARGALRMATSLGTALDSGIINNEMMSEVTGGLQGAEGIQALTGRMMQHTAQFSRRAMGRYSIFGLSNANGTGLDAASVDAMVSGGTSVGELSRNAHRNVGRLGRARAINREGMLRGALLEEGGLAGQIGIMRMAIGDRVMDQGDDMASLWMQRRMRMSRPEAEMMTSLMRNQGTIAENESESRFASRRQVGLSQNIQATRSLDALSAQLGHSIQEGLGVPEVREAGRRFVTKMSQLSERVMNHLMGVAESSMTNGDRGAMNRMSLGLNNSADDARITRMLRQGERGTDNLLGRGLLETGPGAREMFSQRGIRVTNGNVREQFRLTEEARQGFLSQESDINGLRALTKGGDGTRRLANAMLRANGDAAALYGALGARGITANAADAYAAMQGFAPLSQAPDSNTLLGRGPGRHLSGTSGALVRGAAGILGGPAGALLGGQLEGMLGAAFGNTQEDTAVARIAREGGRLVGPRRTGVGDAIRGGLLTAINPIAGGAGIVAALRGRTAGGGSLDEDRVRSYMQSEGFRSSMDRISGYGNDTERKIMELNLMRDQAMRSTGDDRTTQLAMIERMQRNVRAGGGVGRDFTQGSTVDAAGRAELLRSIGDRGSFLSRLGGNWGRAGESLNAVIRASNRGQDNVGDLYNQGMAQFRAAESSFVGMSRDERTAEMRRLTEAGAGMGAEDQERLTQMRRGLMRTAGSVDRLRGRGRGGRRGALGEALGLLGTQEVELNGEMLSTTQIRRRLMRGDSEVAGAVARASGTDNIQQTATDLLAASTGRIDQAGAMRLAQGNEGTRAAAQQRVAQQQRERDPVAAESLDTLRQIRDRLPQDVSGNIRNQSEMLSVLRSIANNTEGGGTVEPAASTGTSTST